MQKFLSLDEMDMDQLHKNRSRIVKKGEKAVVVENATFKWPVVHREPAPHPPAVATMSAPSSEANESEDGPDVNGSTLEASGKGKFTMDRYAPELGRHHLAALRGEVHLWHFPRR